MWRRRPDEDFAREVEAHLALEEDRLVDEGLGRAEARDTARRAFGNVLAARERYHEAHRWVWLEQALLDARYAWRGLRHSPAFLATTVLTLAVGLGLVSALFTIFNAYVLRPFAVREPHTLHQIVWRTRDAGGYQFRWRDFQELRARRDLFDDVLATATRVVLSDGRPVVALFVSGNYFQALGPAMRLGRGLAPYDASAPGTSPVAVLTDEGWTRLFARDAGVLGREVVLNGTAVSIVGVLRPEFSGLDDTPRDIVLPVTMFGEVARTDLFGAGQPREVGLVTRFRRGLTAPQVEAALAPFVDRVVDRDEAVRAEARWLATPNPLTVELLTVLSPVFAAFLLVLVAACANVSNVMLARANARHREIAMRLSLGAGRPRVIRQLMTEGLVIAGLSGLAGLGVSALMLRAGTAVFVAGLPSSVSALVRVAPLDLDHRVFLFSLGIAAATTLVFALVPALHATRLSLTHALRGQAGAAVRGATLRNALVVSQVTVSLVLLIAAATLVRNGLTIESSDVGFATRGVLSVIPGDNGTGEIAEAAGVLRRDPRVRDVAAASVIPFSERLSRVPVVAAPGAAVVPTSYKFVSPEFFSILQIPIVHGRGFTAAEAAAEAPVAIVSAAGAKALWPGANPIGRTLELRVEPSGGQRGQLLQPSSAGASTLEVVVVGVAADAVNGLLVEGIDPSHLYLPTSPSGTRATTLLVVGRSPGEPGAEGVADLLRPMHPDPLALEVLTLDGLREQQMFPLRAASWIGSALGLLALALSVSGLYGVLAYMLSQRTREIGIRVALGATGGAVIRLILAQSARLAAIGALVGAAIAFGVLRLLGAAVPLRNITWIDAPAFGASLLLVACAMALATVVPAWRATRVNPSETLRADG